MMPERSFKPPVWQVKQVPWLGAPVKAGSGIAAFATTDVGLVISSEKPPSAIASTTAAIVAVFFIQHPRLKAVGGMLPPRAEPPCRRTLHDRRILPVHGQTLNRPLRCEENRRLCR